mmetsp:Transcript_44511/g.143129  ORF Transcript_44511/g.143129 Transcript_44511/m.143129 type:complete len:250 (-) Transcript_44511:361-1110(-)
MLWWARRWRCRSCRAAARSRSSWDRPVTSGRPFSGRCDSRPPAATSHERRNTEALSTRMSSGRRRSLLPRRCPAGSGSRCTLPMRPRRVGLLRCSASPTSLAQRTFTRGAGHSVAAGGRCVHTPARPGVAARRCGLNVHPTFGPWHAYRSLVVVAADGVETAGPPPNPSSSEAVAAAEAALQTALAATIDPTATNTREELVGRYREAWRLWQRVRQCVSTPEYDAWKYPDAFDEYHFSHSPALLKRLVG